MKTYQLKFLAWTFSAFLPPDNADEDDDNAEQPIIDYYELLDIPRNANADDIKKAYRKQSLQLHPDKLRQRGMKYQGNVITEDEARARFQTMKAAYDTLSDPKKRQIYDALGHKGMDFVINPSHAYDPHVLMANLAASSIFDRVKLMMLVLVFFGVVLLQPILICAKVDQMLEGNGGALENSSWVAIAIPFWFFALFYGVLLIIGKAVLPLLQWICFVIGILFLTLKFDETLTWDYSVVFIPMYLWMALRLYEAKSDMRSVQNDMSKMVTIEYIEKFVINEVKQDEDGNDIVDPEQQNLHRTYNDLNEEERDDINKEYIIVHVPPKAQAPPGLDEDEDEDDFERIERSPEYQMAKVRYEFASKAMQRIIIPEIPLIILIIVQLDYSKNWNWGIVFIPLWIALVFECCGGCYGLFCIPALAHIEVQEQMEAHINKEVEAKKGETKDGDDAEKGGEVNGKKTEEDSGDKYDVDQMKIGQIKAELDARKVSYADCLDRDSLEARLKDARSSSNAEKSELTTDKEDIDTAVVVEPSTKTDTSSAKSEVDKTKDESKEPDEDDDDNFMFEMDEDTFHHFQQAEVEAENKATEAQSKAIGSFCNIIFQAIIAAVFVAKLNQVYEEQDMIPPMDSGTSSFSTFWILFPFLLISGCIICCFACAIFGASNLDTVLNDDENGDEAGEDRDNDAGGGEETAEDNSAASPAILTPPQPTAQVVEDPPEQKKEEPKDVKGTSSAPAVAEEEAPTETEDMDDLD